MRKAADIILECLEEKRMSQSSLAKEMGEDVRLINQQLMRYKDLKFGRFKQVLEFIGYRVEIVENDGIRRISQQKAMDIISTRKPEGRFWFCTESENSYSGLDNISGKAQVRSFSTKEECLKWLRGEVAEDITRYLDDM